MQIMQNRKHHKPLSTPQDVPRQRMVWKREFTFSCLPALYLFLFYLMSSVTQPLKCLRDVKKGTKSSIFMGFFSVHLRCKKYYQHFGSIGLLLNVLTLSNIRKHIVVKKKFAIAPGATAYDNSFF